MVRNEKAEFAVKTLLEYAKENGINGRDTTDLSPLEQWLILRLYNAVVGQSEDGILCCIPGCEKPILKGFSRCSGHVDKYFAQIKSS